jgi:hypothetical protein
MAAKKKVLVKSASIEKTIATSVANLVDALEKADKAIQSRAAESKKMLVSGRRLRKRRAALLNKKKRAVAAEKKNSTVETRKAVKTITSELVSTGKETAKVTAARQVVLAELTGLKASQKKLSGYVRGINTTDKQIAKPKRRARRKAAA